MDGFAQYKAISDSLRNTICTLELVTTLRKDDGSTVEVTDVRSAVCKKAQRRPGRTILTFADIDLAALERAFPFDIFTAADWPEIYPEHVGRRVAQGVGTVVRVPLTWISKSGGSWKYAGPKVIGSAGTVSKVYRGTRAGDGVVVNSSEYTTGTASGASTGVTVLTVNFAREQIDFNGRPYVLEADISLPGSRSPSSEIARILTLYGISYDSAAFTTAASNDATAGSLIDALYGGDDRARSGKAIIEDLLAVARGWLSQSSSGWTIVQDVAKTAAAEFDTASDLIHVEEYGDADIQRTVSIAYRPISSASENFQARLERTTNGQTGELRLQNPYIRDHVVADKLVCYWQKRLNTARMARAAVYATQIPAGTRISINDNTVWSGTKDFIVVGNTRAADCNRVLLREYDAGIYTYTAATLPTDPTPPSPGSLPAPTVTVTQVQSKEVKVTLSAVADVEGRPKVRRYALLEQVSGNGYTEVARSEERTFIRTVVTGTPYDYKARTEDVDGNESADSSVASITPAKKVDDNYIIGEGVGSGSLAAAGVLRTKLALSTWTASGTVNAGSSSLVTLGGYANLNFFPSIYPSDGSASFLRFGPGSSFSPSVYIHNSDSASHTWAAGGTSMTP